MFVVVCFHVVDRSVAGYRRPLSTSTGVPLVFYVDLFTQVCTQEEHQTIDKIIDNGKLTAGSVQRQIVLSKDDSLY